MPSPVVLLLLSLSAALAAPPIQYDDYSVSYFLIVFHFHSR